MRLTRQQIIDASAELADYAESFDPDEAEHIPIAEYRLWRVARNRSTSEEQLLDAVAQAGDDGIPVERVAELMGVSADAVHALHKKAEDRHRTRGPHSRSIDIGR